MKTFQRRTEPSEISKQEQRSATTSKSVKQ